MSYVSPPNAKQVEQIKTVLLAQFETTPGWFSLRLIAEKTIQELDKNIVTKADMSEALYELWKSCLIFKHSYKGEVFYKQIPKENRHLNIVKCIINHSLFKRNK